MQLIRQQWFLISLLLAMAVGTSWAAEIEPVTRSTLLRNGIVAVVMFLVAWPLQTSVIADTLRRPWAALLASLLNLGLAPLLGISLSYLLAPKLATGFFVAAVTPCTLASAAVWTRRAGGNDATAIMTTLITNSVCFVITPLWIFLVLSDDQLQLSLPSLMARLFGLVILPMGLAQFTRVRPFIASWASEHKQQLSVVAQAGILLMVLIGCVQTSSRVELGESSAWFSISILILLTSTMHFSLLASGWSLSGMAGFSRADQIAVGFSASQKTLMVGLVICLQLGVTVLPLLVYHGVQLIGDTLVADWLRRSSPEDVP